MVWVAFLWGGGGEDCTIGGGVYGWVRGLKGLRRMWTLCWEGKGVECLLCSGWGGREGCGEDVDVLMEAWKIRAGWSMN